MTTVTTVLLSYNRPRMLREALATCLRCDQLIVIDDGSDFDARALIYDHRPDAQLVTAPRMSLEQRLITPRLGRLINTALSFVTCDVVTYLCDDDLFHPGWLDAVRNWFDANPAEHWTRGLWYAFDDGETPGTRVCPLDQRLLTTGNFAHRASCYQTCGIRWNETSIACHDDMFFWDVHRVHNTYAISDSGAVAGWRRLHKHNALGYTSNAVYHANAHELFKGGWLE